VIVDALTPPLPIISQGIVTKPYKGFPLFRRHRLKVNQETKPRALPLHKTMRGQNTTRHPLRYLGVIVNLAFVMRQER
jgi:hypothetical protein